MISDINYYCQTRSKQLGTFIIEIKDTVHPMFRLSLVCLPNQMFFASLLMSGVVAMDYTTFTPSTLAVRIKNQLEEKMRLLELKWTVVMDEENEVGLLVN